MVAIYLDHAATTPLHPEVYDTMMPYFTDYFGNPSSIHLFGRKNRSALDEARATIASMIHTKPSQLIFTGGGTESDNTALIGTAYANREKGNHIITSQIEHHAVLHTCEYLEKLGFNVTYLPVDEFGQVSQESVKSAITDKTILISIMYGNNEVGTLQPIKEIGHIARDHGIYLHTDAVQAIGILPIDVHQLGVDLLSISAHKMNGPKGVGALYVAPHVKMFPHLFGGAQERNRRAGTENVAGIVGFAKAMELANNDIEVKRDRLFALRQTMLTIWKEKEINCTINGHPEQFMPHILNVSFPGTDTESMLMNLDLAGIAASSGSACTAGSLEISHVLKAMDIDPELQKSAIRFSFGYGTELEDVNQAALKTAEIINRAKV